MKTSFLTLALIASLGTMSLAQDANVPTDISTLTPSQKADVYKVIAQATENNQKAKAEAERPMPQKVDEWVAVGTNVGKSLAGAAKETNTAVNEFAKTPVGVMTTVLIVWHFMGNQMYHMFGALLVLSVGFFTVRGFANRCRKEIVTEDKDGKKTRVREELEDGAKWGVMVAYAVVLVGSIIVMFTGK